MPPEFHQDRPARAGEDPLRAGQHPGFSLPDFPGPLGGDGRQPRYRRAAVSRPGGEGRPIADRHGRLIPRRSSLAEEMARALRRDARGVHGRARHPDHEFVAQGHRGRDRLLHRRRLVDLDRVSGGRDRDHRRERHSRIDFFDQAVPSFQRVRIPDLFRALRVLRQSPGVDRLPRPSRDHRRGADSTGVQHHPRRAAKIEAADRPGSLRLHRDVRTLHRPDDRRLAD